MDMLKLLRDPVWQAVGAVLTGIGIIIPVLLSEHFRKWIVEIANKLLKLVQALLTSYGAKTLLYVIAFILPSLGTTEIVSSITFSLLTISLLIETWRYLTGRYLFTRVLLLTLTIIYVVPKILIFREEIRSWIPPLFFSSEVHLLIMILVFGIMQDLQTTMKTEEYKKTWLEPFWEHQKHTAERLSKAKLSLSETMSSLNELSAKVSETTSSLNELYVKVSQLQATQAPVEKAQPQWWQLLEVIKVKKLSFTGILERSNYEKASINYYDIVVHCNHQITRDTRTLKIIFPTNFVDPLDQRYTQKIAGEIAIEAGHVFEGYSVSWDIQNI